MLSLIDKPGWYVIETINKNYPWYIGYVSKKDLGVIYSWIELNRAYGPYPNLSSSYIIDEKPIPWVRILPMHCISIRPAPQSYLSILEDQA